MEEKEQILRDKMSAKYCGETRFDFLDEEEKMMIYAAMEAYHIEKTKATRNKIVNPKNQSHVRSN